MQRFQLQNLAVQGLRLRQLARLMVPLCALKERLEIGRDV